MGTGPARGEALLQSNHPIYEELDSEPHPTIRHRHRLLFATNHSKSTFQGRKRRCGRIRVKKICFSFGAVCQAPLVSGGRSKSDTSTYTCKASPRCHSCAVCAARFPLGDFGKKRCGAAAGPCWAPFWTPAASDFHDFLDKGRSCRVPGEAFQAFPGPLCFSS